MSKELMMKNRTLVAAALRSLGLTEKSAFSVKEIKSVDGVTEILLATIWMEYDLYLDERTHEVLGCDAEPVTA